MRELFALAREVGVAIEVGREKWAMMGWSIDWMNVRRDGLVVARATNSGSGPAAEAESLRLFKLLVSNLPVTDRASQ